MVYFQVQQKKTKKKKKKEKTKIQDEKSEIYFVSQGFSPTKPKPRAIWVRKDSLR